MENSRISSYNFKTEFTIRYVVQELGKGTSDKEIIKYAKEQEVMLVTRDRRLLVEAIKAQCKVALYLHGYAIVVSDAMDLLTHRVPYQQ